MSTLILCLPDKPVTPDSLWHHVVSSDGLRIQHEGVTPTSELIQLSNQGSQLLAVVPARALSWHRVVLPQGVAPASLRMRAVLEGLLEDRLLDDPVSLHFALSPPVQAGTPQWVAACDRRWLAQALQALETAQLSVTRIVPEWEPCSHEVQWHVTGTGAHPQLLVRGPEGVSLFPLTPDAITLAQGTEALVTDALVSAEPDLVDLATEWLQRPVIVLPRAQRWATAAQSAWNLAQFDMASSWRLRLHKRVHQGWRDWLRAPRWRAARWGVALLLGTNLLGLNVMAWQEKRQLEHTGSEVRSVLDRSFPYITVVVDAPLQMEREVRRLELAAGVRSADSLEAMLDLLSNTLASGTSLQSVDYGAGELRVKEVDLAAAESAALMARLQTRGYVGKMQGNTLVLQLRPTERRLHK